MIHVCYGLHDKDGRYSKFIGTSILSMFENVSCPPPSVTVHILHDDTLTDDNRDKFSYIAGRYNQQIKFYNVEKICAEEISKLDNIFSKNSIGYKKYTIGALLRLLIPKIFPSEIKKIIYLDADTIVNLDINELWNTQLEDKIIAAVPESLSGNEGTMLIDICKHGYVDPEDYFNSGVLMFNLEKFSVTESEKLLKELDFITEESLYFDQDVLNYHYSKNFLKLSDRFNFFVRENRIKKIFKLTILYSITLILLLLWIYKTNLIKCGSIILKRRRGSTTKFLHTLVERLEI